MLLHTNILCDRDDTSSMGLEKTKMGVGGVIASVYGTFDDFGWNVPFSL